MGIKIRKTTDSKKVIRFKRKRRIRANLFGSKAKPRLAVFKSNAHIYAQLIDDESGVTLAAASTLGKSAGGGLKCNLASAKTIGQIIAKKALEKKIDRVVFDRSGYLYHGKIKAFADAAREAGLKF
ncbi:MAG: 50S ribosomal protein L18 [Deltaproteobacteria bacterium]|nr:50S ribosomal protein L18 [Deltaproteobacteria bacterium]